MMKISGFSNVQSASDVKKRRAVAGSGLFSSLLDLHETQEAAAAESSNDIAAMGALGHLLAVQEVSPDDVNRKKALQRGKYLLDSLEKLRQELIAGRVSAHVLQDLSRQLSAQKQEFNDPKLLEILGDIELRAAVELAKLEMNTKR